MSRLPKVACWTPLLSLTNRRKSQSTLSTLQGALRLAIGDVPFTTNATTMVDAGPDPDVSDESPTEIFLYSANLIVKQIKPHL